MAINEVKLDLIASLRFDPGSPHFKTQNYVNFYLFSIMLDHCRLLHQGTTLDTNPTTNLIKQLQKYVHKHHNAIVLKMSKFITFALASCKKLLKAFSRHAVTPL